MNSKKSKMFFLTFGTGSNKTIVAFVAGVVYFLIVLSETDNQ